MLAMVTFAFCALALAFPGLITLLMTSGRDNRRTQKLAEIRFEAASAAGLAFHSAVLATRTVAPGHPASGHQQTHRR
jgi:hypothetical protein